MRPLRLTVLSLAMTAVTAGCRDVTYEIHGFVPLESAAAPGLRIKVLAHGHWHRDTTRGSAVSVSESPYVIEVRVYGSRDSSVLGSVTFRDSLSGSTAIVDRWETFTFDESDSSLVFAHRAGVPLSRRTQLVSGTLHLSRGDAGSTPSFSGAMRYQFRTERKNSFLEALRGI